MKKLVFDQGEGVVYRPPSEDKSFILRVTTGCSHNGCTFCNMYRDVKFRVRSMEDIAQQIALAAEHNNNIRRVFLADGNAMVLPTPKLLQIIGMLKESFPKLNRISCYAGARDLLNKPLAELVALQQAGLKWVYLGVESGDEQVLRGVNKGVGVAEMIDAGKKVLAAGLKLVAMIILGLGGKADTTAHALNTARLINEVNPTMVAVLTLELAEDMPLATAVQRGQFQPLSTQEVMGEFKLLVENINVQRPCLLDSTHPFNLLPIRGTLPQAKGEILLSIQQVQAALAD